MNRKIICTSCPNGCEMAVAVENGAVTNVKGNTCLRGEEYARNEIENPKRMLTTTMKVVNGTHPLLPVRTRSPIPKVMLFDCMALMNATVVEAPIESGETILANILQTGIDVIATKSISRI
ncbi:MAG: DUF1667 domain-containing protein [Christensenellales bacterium]